MECLVALFAFVWEIARPSRLLNYIANMLLLGEMFSQALLVSKHFIALAAMVTQCFLVGVLSTAVTAVMWSRVLNISYMSKVLSKIREVNITLPTMAMFCDLFMGLKFRQTKKSFLTLLALWMLLLLMLEDCLFLREMEVAMGAAKRFNGRRSRYNDRINNPP